jgi:hypothetical protein
MMKRTATGLLFLILFTSACGTDGGTSSGGSTGTNIGGDGLTTEETMAVATIEQGYPSSDWGEPGDPKQAHCWAVGMVTDFGIERLQKYGVVDANLEFDQVSSKPMSAPDAALFTDIEFRCDGDSFESGLEDLIRGDSRGDMSDAEMERCLQAVTEEDARQASEGFLREDGEPVEAFFDKLRQAGCGDFYGG